MAAQSGQRVLFVDGDFWKSGAGAVLGIRSSAGLADLLEGKAKLVDAVMSDVTSGADIILPGKFSRASLVAWIGKLPELLDTLKSQYDVIIIDAPPILAVSEATLLAGHADADGDGHTLGKHALGCSQNRFKVRWVHCGRLGPTMVRESARKVRLSAMRTSRLYRPATGDHRASDRRTRLPFGRSIR
jgi:hypothetical protein